MTMSHEDMKVIWRRATDRQFCNAIGVVTAAGYVWKVKTLGDPVILGPLEGATAGVTDGTRVHRVGGPVAASMVLGPVGLLGSLSTKSKATSYVALADGTVHEGKLDGNSTVRAAQKDAARFNARALPAEGELPVGRPYESHWRGGISMKT